ncbi:MAG: shikimate dehydrogenase [Rhodobacterales bacterium]|nr:MAG: shikimate dehydrogenase [Rhodobacterales bacterium]
MTDFPLAAVLGHPISHSRSPRMHRFWLAQAGIKGDYTAIDVPPGGLADALGAMRTLGFRGCNVTIPHKIEALELADQATDRAQRIGAANTLIFDDGLIKADNTDGYGFIQNLNQGAPDWNRTAPAVVLGAGGAARAVIDALLDAGVPELRLTNRSRDKADALAQVFGDRVQVVDWQDAKSALPGAGLLVNTTSLGMTGQPDLTLDLAALPASATVTDLVYAPLRTDLLERAAAKGCATVDGLGMLLHQGVPGFEAWFGHRPEVTEELREAVLA